tara:strand:+ start:162 stop:1325 length:1164 start_codon:yes stop_codon:yes gene_type:complete
MSVTRTYTVTVVGGNPSNHPYHNFGSSNKYAIDGSTATADVTLYIAESGTYRFDQSDSSNSGHPLRFSTTANGTHGGGTEYTTGVTTNGTPGQSGAYTEIEVARDAPTLYYYCTNHSGMGWTANTPAAATWGALNWDENTWGSALLVTTGWGAEPWNDAASTWGDVGDEIVELTAPSAMTTNIGVGSAYGDGSWGEEQGWGQFVLTPADVIGLTGVSSTSNVGSVSFTIDATFTPSGVAATSAVGSLTPADVIGISGVSATSAVGAVVPADVIGISGVSATSASGSITINSSPVIIPTGVQATASVGSIDPTAIIEGLTGVAATSAVGTLVPADVMGLTGVSATAEVAAFGTASGFGIQAYEAIDTGSNSSYTNVATGSNTSYSDAA